MTSNLPGELRCVLQVLDVVANECQLRVSFLGLGDLRRAEIDANAFRRLQGVEQVAVTAAKVENALARRYQKAHVAPLFLEIVWMPVDPPVALVGKLFGLFEQELFAGGERALRLGRRCAQRAACLECRVRPWFLCADRHLNPAKLAPNAAPTTHRYDAISGFGKACSAAARLLPPTATGG